MTQHDSLENSHVLYEPAETKFQIYDRYLSLSEWVMFFKQLKMF